MSNMTPPALVVGATRAPLPYGLFSVLAPREGSADRWEGAGVEFETLGTAPAPSVVGPYDCAEDTEGLPFKFEGGDETSTATPFTVYGSFTCNPVGNPINYAQDRAEARLATWEEFQVERELYARFTAATATELGAHDPVEAVAQIESALASQYGSLGVLHVGRGTATHLIRNKVVESRGGRLYTRLGTPVVAGSGYGEGEIYGTPAIFGYRSEVFTSTENPGDGLKQLSNEIFALAMRTYLIGYDDMPSILHTSVTASSGGGSGAPGASAYEIAVAGGFEGDEAAWLESLIGPAGAPGAPGTAATVAVGTVTTGAAGSAAAVTAAGTAQARVLNFTIPRGATGTNGSPGAPGEDGVVQALVAGTGIAVDATDPANPIISAAV